MANYHPPSAPFFGMPPYPQAFPPQSAPPPPGGGPAYQHAPQLPPQQQQLQLQLQLPPQPPQPHNASGFGQNTSLPQMDFQALGLNPAQLAAVWQQVQNGAAPPPLPFPPPFSAQPGFAPPPPPPIPFPAGFQPPAAPSFPIPPPQALPGITPVPQPPAPPSSLPAPNNRVMEIVNGDREEGELSDEPGSQDEPGRSWSRGDSQRGGRGDFNHPKTPAAASDVLRRHPKNSDRHDELSRTNLKGTPGNERHGYGLPSNAKMPSSPRSHGQQAKRSPIQSPPDHVHRESRSEALQHSTIQTRPPANDSAWSRSGQSTLERARFDMSEFEDQRRQAEAFLTTLHNCGYGYVDLQMCGLDPKLIKEVWTSLGFPLDQEPTGNSASAAAIQPKNEPSAPPVSRGAATSNTLPTSVPPVSASTTTASAQLPSKPQSTVGTTGTNKANGGSTASPGDRAAYIARLMAAKNNKATAKATITQGPSSPSPAQTPSVEVHDAPQPDPGPSVIEHTASEPANEPPTDPAVLAAQKKEAQNELLRKKIEALKIPKKKAEEEARAKAQAVAASLSANRTPSSSAEIPVRPAQQEFAAEISTPSKGSQSSSIPLPSPARIPGLFMAAATPPAVPQQPQELSALPANKGRKRPVAADFEDLQQARPPTAFKRPFGQSHNEHEQMIIEVSDDETVDSVMDIDEADGLQPSAQQPSQPLPKVGANRNMPPLTNFPSRPNLSRQGSAQSTPPAVHTPISAAKIEDLRRKEEEIAALKKKLAEKERQRLAKAQSSRAQTPATPTHQPPQLQQGFSPSASVPGNGTSQTQSVVRTEPTSRTGTPTVAASAHTPQSPAQSEWKRRRRAEIQSGISAFDADLNSNLSRLEQLRREMEQIEAENKRRQQEKETLINELESLGIDTEGMPHEELRAKKDEIMQQQEEAAAAAALEVSVNAAEIARLDTLATDSQPVPDQLPRNDVPITNQKASGERAPSESSGEQMSMPGGEVEVESDTTEAEMDMSDSDAEKDGPVPIQISTSTVETRAGPQQKEQEQTALPQETESNSVHPAETSEQEDTEDFYSPEPLPGVPKDPELGVAHAETLSAETSQLGPQTSEPEFAEDDEDDYAPSDLVEEQSTKSGAIDHLPCKSDHQEVDNEPDHHESGTEHASIAGTQQKMHEPSTAAFQPDPANQLISNELQAEDASLEAMDEGEEDYEPSHMLPEPTSSVPAGENPEPLAASLESVTGFSVPQSLTGTSVSGEISSESGKSTSETPAETPQITMIADEVAPVVQSRTSEQHEQDHTVPEVHDVKKHSFYEPYESPLKYFKAYRYHPQYSQTVSGGFKSLTYSHVIDPMKPICSFETAGGICNDSACVGQHFRAMGINEDKILLQMGIVNPGRTPEEQDRWRESLKQVLKDLRGRGVRDVELVAAAIANLRRDFVQDPSKVLNI